MRIHSALLLCVVLIGCREKDKPSAGTTRLTSATVPSVPTGVVTTFTVDTSAAKSNLAVRRGDDFVLIVPSLRAGENWQLGKHDGLPKPLEKFEYGWGGQSEDATLYTFSTKNVPEGTQSVVLEVVDRETGNRVHVTVDFTSAAR